MTGTEQVYGGSLYDLAKEEGLDKELLEQLQAVLAILDENPEYGQFLSTVSISKKDRCSGLEEAFGGRVHPYLLNFMKILTENGTIGQLKGCAAEYGRRYDADNGIVEVRAVTAVPLKEPLRQLLLEKLESILGKTVRLQCAVDPACMGGVLLQLPGRQVDGTIRTRLDALSRTLKTNVL